MDKRKIIESPKQIMINREKAVSAFIPFNNINSAFDLDKSSSQYVNMLNGKWKFCYFPSFFYVEDDIFNKDYNISLWDDITVPSNYELFGYDIPQYINLNYPIPINPPYVPDDNPCGVYVKEFTIPDNCKEKKTELHLEGIGACAFIYVNGSFVGYTTGSHNSASFDISDYIIFNANNRLTIETLKWCAATYLEDQDHFRMTGIFRDVYLVFRERGHIENIVIKYLEEYYNKAEIVIESTGLINVNIKVSDENKKEIAVLNKTVNKLLKTEITIPDINFWSDEVPYLYTFLFNTTNEYIPVKYGFRTIKISDKGELLINGKSVKLKGVNRHDTNPETGYYCSYEDMKRDVIMIKQNNFNCIRTSHYPNSTEFYDLCNKYGLYVIDEADIECHGMMWSDNPNGMSDSEEYYDLFLDKLERMVKRDINHPSVIMWSLGNECGVGKNQIKLYNFLKDFDKTRPIHYEFESYLNELNLNKIFDNYKLLVSDFYGQMYPSFEKLKEYGESGNTQPMLLSEYSHSMGVGPGDVTDYWDIIYKYNNIIGGCIWEWCDHSIYTIKDNKKILCYGGYNGEELNDGNFCADGLVTAERTPTSGLFEVKKALEPIKIIPTDINNGKFIIKSLYNFKDINNLSLLYCISLNGESFSDGEIDIKGLQPNALREFRINYNLSGFEKGIPLIDFKVLINKETEIYKKNFEITHFQFELPYINISYNSVPDESNEVIILKNKAEYIVKTQNVTYAFDRLHGMLKQINIKGEDVLKNPLNLNCWRAEIDNDRNISPLWKSYGLKNAITKCYSIDIVEKSRQRVGIKSEISLSDNSMQPILKGTILYYIYSDGKINIGLECNINNSIICIPCLAFQLTLINSYEKVSFVGRGPQESYIDMKNYAFLGKYNSNVKEQYFPYIRPQENGNHTDTIYVELKSYKNIIKFSSDSKFDFSVLPYSMEDIDKAEYNYQLKENNSTNLRICYKQAGVGSSSCGPKLAKKYTFDEKYIKFDFLIDISFQI